MDSTFNFPASERPIVYVRPVKSEELPAPLRARIGDLPEVYAIHDETGACVALARDRAMAFSLAQTNDLSPVSVH